MSIYKLRGSTALYAVKGTEVFKWDEIMRQWQLSDVHISAIHKHCDLISQ